MGHLACICFGQSFGMDPTAATLFFEECSSACIILFWGLNFAVLDKRHAERAALYALIGGFSLYLVGMLVPLQGGRVYLAGLLNILAMIPFLAGFYTMAVGSPHAPASRDVPLLVRFFGLRVVFGVGIGFSLYLTMGIMPMSPGWFPPGAVVALAVVAAFAVWTRRTGVIDTTVLRIAPFLSFGILIAPFLGTGQEVAAAVMLMPLLCWFCWAMLSSVQISDVKEKIGLDEARLSFSEKILTQASAFAAILVLHLLFHSGIVWNVEGDTGALSLVLLGTAYFIVMASSYALSNLIDAKTHRRLMDRAMEISESQRKRVYEALAEAYHLTERESEVFELMAKGHTRPRICEVLTISEGTARSHITHVNRKLGVHSREELYELVQASERTYLEQARQP